MLFNKTQLKTKWKYCTGEPDYLMKTFRFLDEDDHND